MLFGVTKFAILIYGKRKQSKLISSFLHCCALYSIARKQDNYLGRQTYVFMSLGKYLAEFLSCGAGVCSHL